jgi:hypothetical protein
MDVEHASKAFTKCWSLIHAGDNLRITQQVSNVVDDGFKTMQLNIPGAKSFSAHSTSIL